MENIHYSMNEIDQNEICQNEICDIDPFFLSFTDDVEQLINYYNAYTVKNLSQILHYYGLQKNKMVKDEMIQVLIFFETDAANKFTVKHRLRLWKNIQELKADPYFSKYILF